MCLMTPQESVQFLVAIQSLVIAVSHMVQPKAWVDYFVWLRGLGRTGIFLNGFLTLWFGTIIVAFHNVWSGPEVVITLLGWGQVIKAAVAFIAPSISMKGFERVSHERRHEFVIAGAVLLAISGVCWYVVAAR